MAIHGNVFLSHWCLKKKCISLAQLVEFVRFIKRLKYIKITKCWYHNIELRNNDIGKRETDTEDVSCLAFWGAQGIQKTHKTYKPGTLQVNS